MTKKPNFTKLGVFTLMAIGLILAAVIVFGSGVLNEPTFHFETYFDGSVHGLNRGSVVYDNGVPIGTVESITFVRNDYLIYSDANGTSAYDRLVRIVCALSQEQLPKLNDAEMRRWMKGQVDRGVRLQLVSNILTGQAALEARVLDPNDHGPIQVPWQPMHFYIPSAPSSFATMEETLGNILKKLETLDFKGLETQARAAIGEIQNFMRQAQIAKVSEKIQGVMDEAKAGIGEARLRIAEANLPEVGRAVADARRTIGHLEALTDPNDTDGSNTIPGVIRQLNATLWRLDSLIANESPRIDAILEDLQQTARRLRQVSENLERNPSALIRSTPPVKEDEK